MLAAAEQTSMQLLAQPLKISSSPTLSFQAKQDTYRAPDAQRPSMVSEDASLLIPSHLESPRNVGLLCAPLPSCTVVKHRHQAHIEFGHSWPMSDASVIAAGAVLEERGDSTQTKL